MTVTFDRSVASSIMEAGYNYTPTGNSTISVEFDTDKDIFDALADAGLEHIADSVIYTNYYELIWCQNVQGMWRSQTTRPISTI